MIQPAHDGNLVARLSRHATAQQSVSANAARLQSDALPAGGNGRRAILSSITGTVLEWYDFYIYGTATTLVFGTLFFPNFDETTGMLAAFAAYGVGFFLRPVAGIVLSRFGDTIGRKKVMVVSLVSMGLATGAIGLLPTYAVIGIWAPILLVCLRCIQSIGAGSEFGGALTMISEFSGKQTRGLFASLPALGVSLGILAGTGIYAALSSLPTDAFMTWGWRVPFLLGFALAFVGLYIRLQVHETPAFAKLKRENRILRSPFTHVIRHEWRRLLIASGARSAEAVGAQLFNVFAVSYCTRTLGMPAAVGLTGVMAANLFGLAVIPVGGLLCDRFGRKPVFLTGLAFLAAFTFPFFWLVETRQPWLVTLAFILTYGIGVKIIFAASGAYLTELFEVHTRSTGVTFARTISDPLAGMTPVIATALLVWSGAAWSVALFLIGFAFLAFVCVAIGPETRSLDIESLPS